MNVAVNGDIIKVAVRGHKKSKSYINTPYLLHL